VRPIQELFFAVQCFFFFLADVQSCCYCYCLYWTTLCLVQRSKWHDRLCKAICFRYSVENFLFCTFPDREIICACTFVFFKPRQNTSNVFVYLHLANKLVCFYISKLGIGFSCLRLSAHTSTKACMEGQNQISNAVNPFTQRKTKVFRKQTTPHLLI